MPQNGFGFVGPTSVCVMQNDEGSVAVSFHVGQGAGFAGAKDQAFGRFVGVGEEREALGNNVSVNDVWIEPAKLFGETIAKRPTRQADIVCGLTRLFEARHLVVETFEYDVPRRSRQNDVVNGAVRGFTVRDMHVDLHTQAQRQPRGKQLATR